MSRPTQRILVYLIFSVSSTVVGAIVFQSNFWGDVKCTDGQVLTTIYNASRISEIRNPREIGYSVADAKRTCAADAMVGNIKKKPTFVIDTSRRGQKKETEAPFNAHGEYNKFSVSYQLRD